MPLAHHVRLLSRRLSPSRYFALLFLLTSFSPNPRAQSRGHHTPKFGTPLVSPNPIISIGSNLFEVSVATGTLQHRMDLAFDIAQLREISPELLLVNRRS